MRSQQKGQLADNIFELIFYKNDCVSIDILMNFVPSGPMDYTSALV